MRSMKTPDGFMSLQYHKINVLRHNATLYATPTGFIFLFYSIPGVPPLRGSTPGLLYTTRASAGSYIRRA